MLGRHDLGVYERALAQGLPPKITGNFVDVRTPSASSEAILAGVRRVINDHTIPFAVSSRLAVDLAYEHANAWLMHRENPFLNNSRKGSESILLEAERIVASSPLGQLEHYLKSASNRLRHLSQLPELKRRHIIESAKRDAAFNNAYQQIESPSTARDDTLRQLRAQTNGTIGYITNRLLPIIYEDIGTELEVWEDAFDGIRERLPLLSVEALLFEEQRNDLRERLKNIGIMQRRPRTYAAYITLDEQLKKALYSENYERAAIIRDQINGLGDS
jgi:hypothetical protein